MATQKAYKVRLHIVSPVHIGCDDVYEPTGFSVDKANKKLVAFDPVDFVRSLNPAERQKFMALCDKGNLESILEIYKFMWNLQNVPPGHEVEVSDGFIDTYRRVASMPSRDAKQELNKFLVARTSYLPLDNAPYIPGSALKGSLRTGWLNHLNAGGRQKKTENELMEGSFATDPFRMVKIGDLVPVNTPRTRICFAVNKKKKQSQHEPRGPQQIVEVILPGSSLFEGMITLHSQEQGGGISKPVPVTTDFFVKACGFFRNELTLEEQMLKGINLSAAIEAKMIKTFGERFMKSVFPVRLGRHSGAECLTIDGMRNIKIMGKKGDSPKYGPNSTTVWLAGDASKATSGLLPFGWCALEVLEADPANLWTERIIAERQVSSQKTAAAELARPTIVTETFVWESAVLVWSPGNATLAASADGKKAELKLTGDRSIVPAELHKKLFDKKDAVKAKVAVEKEGNAWRIVSILPLL
jgi:CRISPR-associated protein Csm5